MISIQKIPKSHFGMYDGIKVCNSCDSEVDFLFRVASVKLFNDVVMSDYALYICEDCLNELRKKLMDGVYS